MLAIICTLFTGMKVISANEYFQRSNRNPLSFTQWLAFSLGWFGMNPSVFKNKGSVDYQKGKEMLWFGGSRFLLGLFLVYVASWLNSNGFIQNPGLQLVIMTAILMIGLSLALHFGILSICAGIWRLVGYRTYYLFRKPFLSKSLREFWGKRWNLAFSEMTSIALYRPLRERFGKEFSLIAAFLFSGILHELAISLPVQKGYGLPMLYFLLQGTGQLLEPKIPLNNALLQYLWLAAWLILPLPLLFHCYFLQEIIWPIIGGLSY
jgi:alginate O-acetyltransferase complex protein AlgI